MPLQRLDRNFKRDASSATPVQYRPRHQGYYLQQFTASDAERDVFDELPIRCACDVCHMRNGHMTCILCLAEDATRNSLFPVTKVPAKPDGAHYVVLK